MIARVSNNFRSWRAVKVGAGGYLTGFDQHSDGTLVCRCDTYGGWLYHSDTGVWTQLVSTDTMPAADHIFSNNDGIFEIKIAPSDSNIMYMLWEGKLYRTANKATTWTLCTGWTPVSNLRANVSTFARLTGGKLAIDPLDADVVYIGTMDDGLWRTFDGGATCTLITDVPVGSGSAGGNEPGVNGIIIDPSAAAVSGRSGTIWASSYGEGYYRSTDGGINWSEPAGFTPATCVMHSAITSTGILYAIRYYNDPATANTVWRNTAGTWTQLTHANVVNNANNLYNTIAIDPADEDRIILGQGGGFLLESTDGGDTFGAPKRNVISNDSSDDIPWLEFSRGGSNDPYMSSGDMQFSKVSGETGRLLFSDGIGFWHTTLAAGFTTVPWVSMSKGIEQLVANECVALPDGRLFLASWDRPIFKITDPEVYPSTYIYKDARFNNCGVIEYVRANPDIMAAGMYYSDSCFTTDGWETVTEVTTPTGSAWANAGGKGELVPFSATKFVWTQNSGQGIWFTDDAGQTWARISLTGVNEDTTSAGWLGLGSAYYMRRRCIAPDGLTDGMGYIWHDTAGIYKTTDHGETWTRVFTGTLTNFANFNKKIRCTPGVEGHLWATIGDQSNTGTGAFKRSTDGGVSWSTIADVLEVKDFGFGATASGSLYPRLWLVGWVNTVFGIYYSDDECTSWLKTTSGFPMGSLDSITAIDGDKINPAIAYIGFGGSGYAYSPALSLEMQQTKVKS